MKRTYSEYFREPEICSPVDWLDGWNAREYNIYALYTGLGSCIGRYPIEEVLGLIEDGTHPCDDSEYISKRYREFTNDLVEEGQLVVELRGGMGAKVTREQLLQMKAYYDQRDAAAKAG